MAPSPSTTISGSVQVHTSNAAINARGLDGRCVLTTSNGLRRGQRPVPESLRHLVHQCRGHRTRTTGLEDGYRLERAAPPTAASSCRYLPDLKANLTRRDHQRRHHAASAGGRCRVNNTAHSCAAPWAAADRSCSSGPPMRACGSIRVGLARLAHPLGLAAGRRSQPAAGAGVLPAQLRDDGRILQRRDVLRDFLAARQRAQQPAHDLAGAGFRQHLGEADVIGLGDRAQLLADPLAQFGGEPRRLRARRPLAATDHVGEDRLALHVMRVGRPPRLPRPADARPAPTRPPWCRGDGRIPSARHRCAP